MSTQLLEIAAAIVIGELIVVLFLSAVALVMYIAKN
jgi:hypothetical protein